jgi:hypothetical protein
MRRRGFFIRFILALVLIAVLALGGMALFRGGWSQGYQAGVIAASSAEGEALPVPPYYGGLARYPYTPGFGFPLLACFLGIGFFMLVFFLFGAIFRPWGWAGHYHRGWRYGRKRPPWARGWEEHHQESNAKDDDVL